jgi:hypothetical protein
MKEWKARFRLSKNRDPQTITTHIIPDPGDLPRQTIPGQEVHPEAIRELRELIQLRYELDLDIWDSRKCGPWDKEFVQKQMVKSDAVLYKINRILSSWEDPGVVWNPEDFEKVQQIKWRIQEGGKRQWTVNPPWGED